MGTNPPCFSVERLSLSLGGGWLLLSGPQGASLLELPRRWGPHGGYQGGRSVVTCRIIPVDERYFTSSPLAELVQVKWHPQSTTDSHFMILTAENTLRLYDARSPGTISLLQIWQIGRRPSALPPTPSKLPFLTGLGETAVDFDFAPPIINNEQINLSATSSCNVDIQSTASNKTLLQENRKNAKFSESHDQSVYWPVLVLKGNGDIFMIAGSFNNDRPYISSALSMVPSAADNYGSDSCGILVLPSTPPLVVVADSSGILYHCILLPVSDEEVNVEVVEQFRENNLHVIEIVELELGLQLAECNVTGPQDVCPLKLMRDDANPARYLVSHNAGVHAVTVSIIEQLQEYLEIDNDFAYVNVPSLNAPSSAEYLLCTKLDRINSSSNCPVLGLAIVGAPPSLVILLASGKVVSLQMTTVPFNLNITADSEESLNPETKSPLKQMLKEPFDAHIRRCLKQKQTQPIIKLNSDSENPLEPQHCFELLTRATQGLREQYFTKHDQARQEIQKRVRALQLLKTQQLSELERLASDKNSLQNEAERLAERCEDVRDKQEALCKRAENLLRLASQKSPRVTPAEHEFAEKLKNSQIKFGLYQTQLQRARNTMQHKAEQIKEWKAQNKKQDINLNDKHISTIKATLHERTIELTDLVQQVTFIQKALNMS